MAQHNDLGQWGEQIARDYLIGLGYTIVNSNMHVGHKEIDIVATKGPRMIFVEVKTRAHSLDEALDAIDEKKMQRIIRAAKAILCRYSTHYEAQFDVVAVVGTPETGHTVTHLPDAFYPPLAPNRR